MHISLSGIYAALLTPVDEQGAVDYEGLHELIDFVLARGVAGICMGGATAEYPHFDLAERKRLISEAADHLKGRGTLLTAIGASATSKVLELGRHACEAGSAALLLAMPHFYTYEQTDLKAFCTEVSRALEAPCLLYNLPAFTNGLSVETCLELLERQPYLVGMKDSSGNRAAQPVLARARRSRLFTLLCGSDAVLFSALQAGWDGAISGMASFCPELLVALYQHAQAGDLEAAEQDQQLLDRAIDAFQVLPFPWGIRVGAEVRGIRTGPFAVPVSPERQEQIDQLRRWLEAWLGQCLSAVQVI